MVARQRTGISRGDAVAHAEHEPRADTVAAEPRFDVFISYSRDDEQAVVRVAERLRRDGLQPWVDRWFLTPGDAWQAEIAAGLRASGAYALFVGPTGLGDWAREELAVAQERAVKDRGFRLFMVLLPGAPQPHDPSLAFLSTRTWVDLRQGIESTDGLRQLVSAIRGVALALPDAPGRDDVCPYRGLEAFQESDAELFFGREDDTARVLELLKEGRFLAVVAASGSGKSSLVRAGVVSALRRGELPGSEGWAYAIMTPGPRPLAALSAQIARLGDRDSMHRTLDLLRADERTLELAVVLATSEPGAPERCVLVVDQFEEVFTLCADEDERRAFLDNLLYAATIPGGRTVVLLAIRADFYERCAAYPQLRALVAQQYLLGPLTGDGLRRAIEEPARRVGLDLEAGLVETILADVAHQPGALPLLEHVLLEVWERRLAGMLTLEAYVASGGVEGALAQRANTIYAGLTDDQQAIARRVLLRLTQPGDGTEDTRRRAPIDELVVRPGEEADVERVITALTNNRLLSAGRDEATGVAVVDVTHEALIRGWPELRAWVNEDRDSLRLHRRLTETAREWQESEHDPGLLYSGARLVLWHDRPEDQLNDLERRFLATSRERAARERAASSRRRRIGTAALVVALTVISTVAALAIRSRHAAVDARQLAESRALAASADASLAIDPEHGLELALQALARRRTPEAERVLRQAGLESRVRAIFDAHAGPVNTAATSPDGRVVASGGADGGVRLWNPRGGGARLLGHVHGAVLALAFSADGRLVAAGSDEGAVSIWPRDGRGRVVALDRGEETVNGLAFSPDARLLATAGDDGSGGTVKVGPPVGASTARVVARVPDGVNGVAFSPDGRRVAAAGADGAVWMADAGGGAQERLGRPGAPVRSVAFSGDGRRVAAGDSGGIARVYDVAARRALPDLNPDEGILNGVALTPDGRYLATAGGDGTAQIRDLDATGAPVVLRGHRGAVLSIGFGPSRGTAITTGADGTVRIWRAGPDAELVRATGQGALRDAAARPDGSLIASTGADGTVELFARAGAAGATTLQDASRVGAHGLAVTFDASGDIVAAGGEDGSVRVWDVGRASAAGRSLDAGTTQVNAVALGPGGGLIAAADDDGRVRVRPVAGAAHWRTIGTHGGDPATAVAFSPDGRLIASAGDDGAVRLWPSAGGRGVVVGRHLGPVDSVAFDPRDAILASAGDDGTVRLWDLRRRRELRVLEGHQGFVLRVAFSPDGRLLASAGRDGTVRLWDAARGVPLAVLRGHLGSVFDVQFVRVPGTAGTALLSAGADGTLRRWRCPVCGSLEQVRTVARASLPVR